MLYLEGYIILYVIDVVGEFFIIYDDGNILIIVRYMLKRYYWIICNLFCVIYILLCLKIMCD